ncbi:DUF1015 domain-containing protein [Anaerosacchariphilus sp. NSJ-68]|uniref:DUF1015 domain-containing protein n=2 Tax=Lachnospiraceae TaxID=186803 RepID=A0A923LBC6_9FIRM|nr:MULTISPECIES: DUF1015 family protein [Lachnospiraceae]MBC5659451.1 DUF1015 domain-containing protein [Anaerosacchariphilus hominis]MBC5697117.1 DUF1015 domain-containing protein [Roseburia difficilis]
MAEIRAFRGIRPAAGKEADIAALPYDVYNREEARRAVEGRPLSFLRIDRAETQLPEDTDIYAPEVYQKAKELLWGMVEDGDFVQDSAPCYYLYELTMNGRSQTGIVACASIDDYLNGVIKKHENTRREKEEDRVRHVDTCDAQTGPIFLAYRNQEVLKKLVAEVKEEQVLFDFTSEDGIRHRGWKIADTEKIRAVYEAFHQMNALYIADGHHRAASAVRVGVKRREEHPGYTGEEEFNYFLSVIFPDDELMIMDYNRVVRDLNGLTPEEFLDRVQQVFKVEALTGAEHPKKKGQVTLFLEERWYLLTLKPEYENSDPVEGLDVSILQKQILEPVLGIQDPKTDKRIDFVGGIRGLPELERRVHTDMKVAFVMYPTSIGELFAVADAGRLMPPKSTWFEPKLRSGLFIHPLR